MKAANTLTAERLRQLLHYDPDTGWFTRLVSTSNSVKVGDRAGCKNKVSGYLVIQVDGRLYLAHRLAWLYVHGEWPRQHVDHLNGCRHDNRIANLRDVSNQENQQNQRRAQRNNKSTGVLGVSWNSARSKFEARIQANGRHIHLGLFDTIEEAAAVRKAAERTYYPSKPQDEDLSLPYSDTLVTNRAAAASSSAAPAYDETEMATAFR